MGKSDLDKIPAKASSVSRCGSGNEAKPEGPVPNTWKDSRTGLEWQYESPGRMTWYEALEYAESLSLNGLTDWRLPTAPELETLLDRDTLFDELRPSVRKEVPFRDHSSYWSSTTFADNTKNAWIVMFNGGYVLSYYKSNAYCVRCVRG